MLIQVGFEIRDLESTTSYFQTEANYWSFSNTLAATNVSQCSTAFILGGYGVIGPGTTFTRLYSSLPSHNSVYFLIKFWLIDIETSADLFHISLDGQLLNDWNSNGFNGASYPALNICGGAKKDFPSIIVNGRASHIASSLTLTITSMFNSATDVFSFGFRNVYLLFQTSTTTSQVCSFILPSDASSASCLCSQGQYDPPGSSTCTSCSTACETCTGSSSSAACTSCASGYSFNGNACYSCDTTCNQCKGTASTDCIRCSSSMYLYWNGTCQSSCNTPLIITTEGDYKSCSRPCNSSSASYYYQQNSTCQSSCPTPFVMTVQNDINYCTFPCGSSQFLYSNGSCGLSCNTPLISFFTRCGKVL